VIDLHTHSRFSDGSDSPTTLAKNAARAGISAIALTDHDTTASHEEMATACADEGIRLIPGVELSLKDPEFPKNGDGRSVHVLAYFLPLEANHPIQQKLATLRLDRRQRNEKLIATLQGFGFDEVTFERVTAEAGNVDNIGRPHVAAVMVAQYPAVFGPKGQETTQKIFAEWLGTDAKAYIPRDSYTIDEFVAAAAGSGTLFSVAHPIMNYLGDWSLATIERAMPRVIHSLRDRGFVGVESYYGGFDAPTRALMVKLTRDAGLIPTGGSDYHGSYKPDVALGRGRVGDLVVPEEILDELDARR